MGRNSGPIHPSNGPHESLRRERCPSVSKTEGSVEVHGSVPLNSEVGDVAGIEENPPVPAGHIRFPDMNPLVWIPFACTDDLVNDGHGIREREFPWVGTM